MTRYYISNPNAERGFDELTEAEWLAIIGNEPERSYAAKVYRGAMTIDDVPEENREAVAEIVENKTAKWGEYSAQEISSDELGAMVEEAL